ncbi:hypothetical protein [Campylobacter pinnipediorum]|nr:hypothetical protein [Campylobacter pinnipediorum]
MNNTNIDTLVAKKDNNTDFSKIKETTTKEKDKAEKLKVLDQVLKIILLF